MFDFISPKPEQTMLSQHFLLFALLVITTVHAEVSLCPYFFNMAQCKVIAETSVWKHAKVVTARSAIIVGQSQKPYHFESTPFSQVDILTMLNAIRKNVTSGSLRIDAQHCATSCEWFVNRNKEAMFSKCQMPVLVYEREMEKRCLDMDADVQDGSISLVELKRICSKAAMCAVMKLDGAPTLSSNLLQLYLRNIVRNGVLLNQYTEIKNFDPIEQYVVTGRREQVEIAMVQYRSSNKTRSFSIDFMEYEDELDALEMNRLSHLKEKILLAKETYTIDVVHQVLRNSMMLRGLESMQANSRKGNHFYGDTWLQMGNLISSASPLRQQPPVTWHVGVESSRSRILELFKKKQIEKRFNAEKMEGKHEDDSIQLKIFNETAYVLENSDVQNINILHASVRVRNTRIEGKSNTLYSTIVEQEVRLIGSLHPSNFSAKTKVVEPFDFIYTIQNNYPSNKNIIVRLFMTRNLGSSSDWFEMDKFAISLKPNEIQNIIRDPSMASVVSKYLESAFRPNSINPLSNMCGIPLHMYVPVGSAAGEKLYMAAFVSSFEKDTPRGTTVTNFNARMQDQSSLCLNEPEESDDTRILGYPLHEHKVLESSVQYKFFNIFPVTVYASKANPCERKPVPRYLTHFCLGYMHMHNHGYLSNH